MKTKTIAGLLVVTSITTAVGTNAFKELKEKEAVEVNNIMEQEKIKSARDELQKIQKLYTNVKILKSTLKEMNKMIVAKGTIETSYRFTNKDKYVMRNIDGLYNMMECLWGKLSYHDIILTAKYNYNVTYDLSKINVELESNTLKITLYETYIHIEDVCIDYDSAYVDENNGIFARDFTSNQTAAMIAYSQNHTANYIRTNQEFTDNAINSLENNIKELCRKLGIENYYFKVYENNTLTNNDKFMNVNNYNQQGVYLN